MKRTANAIIRSESWVNLSVSVPPELAKKFKKALIDADCLSREALLAFIHSIATGELQVSPQSHCYNRPGHGFRSDTSGVFDDDRVLIKTFDGKVINPLPFSNKFLEKF